MQIVPDKTVVFVDMLHGGRIAEHTAQLEGHPAFPQVGNALIGAGNVLAFYAQKLRTGCGV